jgi:hypothetical protein
MWWAIGLAWEGRDWRGTAATLPLTGFPEEPPQNREPQKLAFGSDSLRFFIRFYGVSSGSAECGAAPVPPLPSQPDRLRSTCTASTSLRIFVACAKPASGCAGGCWRPAFGAAEDTAAATEKEAHMFERSEFMRFPSTPLWLREPLSRGSVAAGRQQPPARPCPRAQRTQRTHSDQACRIVTADMPGAPYTCVYARRAPST